ncbi:cytochrome C oxidase subunit IV family protein [Neorhizobium sp. DT-125]|uniref:cytochrome C oxidase subunit IV family protein n=1 Tax=Neorhizobium sp. DT-125 TaxID=3396163 RepID=UPI003F1A7D98
MQKTASFVFVWFALVLLLAATVTASFIWRGAAGLAVSLGIAFAKAGLIYWHYMHLSEEEGLQRIAALGAGAWLLILFAFVCADYLTR